MKKFDLLTTVVVAIAIILAMITSYIIVERVVLVKNADDDYEQVAEEAKEENYSKIIIENPDTETEVEEYDPRAAWLDDNDGQNAYKMNVDADKLLEINEDYIGWIYGCGGDVDYPVCETEDDQFYLKHGFDKSKNIYGTLFTETLDNGFLYTDVVVYGHHMKNGSMFQKICNYKDEEYYKEHPFFYVFIICYLHFYIYWIFIIYCCSYIYYSYFIIYLFAPQYWIFF